MNRSLKLKDDNLNQKGVLDSYVDYRDRPQIKRLKYDNSIYYGEVYEIPESNDYDEFIGAVSILHRNGVYGKEKSKIDTYENQNGKYVPNGHGRLVSVGLHGATMYEGLFRNGK